MSNFCLIFGSQCSNKRTPSLADDEELKSRIIARYSYVDKDEDSKEHKPVAPKIVSLYYPPPLIVSNKLH